MRGTLTAQQSTDFSVEIWDVTAQYTNVGNSPLGNLAAAIAQRAAAPANETLLAPNAIVISRTPVAAPDEVLV